MQVSSLEFRKLIQSGSDGFIRATNEVAIDQVLFTTQSFGILSKVYGRFSENK